MKKYFWVILIILAAIGLAGSAAYFSISGLSKLFSGSAMQVIIMASFIEFAKLVTTAALHRYWNRTKWWMKYTLTAMVISVMLITSSGIYGFLADAYSATSVELDKIQGQIELVEKQQEQKRVQIKGIEEIKIAKSDRMNSLINLRIQQEARLDSLYNRGAYSSAKKTQALIDQSTEEIKGLQVELDTIANRINKVNTEIGELDIQILDLENTDIATELGPLKYMSRVLDRPMDDIINWFILMLIFVFDPLAVLLVIFASNVYDATRSGSAPPDEGPKNGLLKRVKDKFLKKRETQQEEIEEESEENIDWVKIIQEESDKATDKYNEKNGTNARVEIFPMEDLQKVSDSENNVEPEIYDYNYSFNPDEKADEVVEYIAGKSGNFEKSSEPKESVASLISGIDSNPLYLQLLDIFFLEGQRKVGDIIPPYEVFLNHIREKGIDCPEKVVKNFLTISNLLGIVNMADKNKVTIIKDYKASKQIISLVSK